MSEPETVVAPYGAWRSPVQANDLAAATRGLNYVTTANGLLYWIESRPAERGRNVLMAAAPDAAPVEISPPASNVRSRVHEYGGLPYVVVGNTVVYSEFADQLLYSPGRPHELGRTGLRYADGAARSGTLYLVREDHGRPGEPVNAIVAIDFEGGAERILYDRSDFVAYPRPSPDGRLAFITWNHPNMPWDSTSLHVGALNNGSLVNLRVIAGAPASSGESVLEPVWAEDGTLYFLSDRSGYWNLYRWRRDAVEPVTSLDADLGGALWNLGLSTYALVSNERALVRVCRNATDRLAVVDLNTGVLADLTLPFQSFHSIGVLDRNTGFAVAAADDAPPALIAVDLSMGTHRTVRSAGSPSVPVDFVSRGRKMEFPTKAGTDGMPRTAHAFFYPPHNPGFTGPPGTRPPLIVLLHGGPTSHAAAALNPATQFWTSRGFAVVDVNYGGSTGFGRAYRERLRGQWGVVDLDDAVAAVDHLASTGQIDGARVAIRGGSAGGYTVLAALAFSRRFAAGINYFGVADLEALASDTHKFEGRYLDSLIAPLPAGRDIYRARSPIHHLDALDAALITFQGDEDRAVPPEQSRRITAAVRKRGRPVAYIEFAGEQHGFRQAQNIARALEAELYFLGRVFGFEPADVLEPVPIDNLAPTQQPSSRG